MPPAEVTTIKLEPKTLPASFEYVGQTTGSKEVEVRARVTGILEKKLYQEGAPVKAGQPLFVIDPRQLDGADRRARGRGRPRAGAEGAGRARGRAPEAARRAQGDRPEGSRRRGLATPSSPPRRSRPPRRSSPRCKLNLGYTRVTAPITRLVEPRAEIGRQPRRPPTRRCSPRSRRSIRCGSPFSISENEQLQLKRAVQEGRLTLPKDNALRRRGAARRRLDARRARAASTSPTRASIRRPARSRCARRSPTAIAR